MGRGSHKAVQGRVEQLRDALVQAGQAGLTRDAAMALLGLRTRDEFRKVCEGLRAAGWAECTLAGGPRVMWFTPQWAAHWRERRDKAAERLARRLRHDQREAELRAWRAAARGEDTPLEALVRVSPLKLGWRDWVTMLRRLQRQTATTLQMAQAFGTTGNTMRALLYRMRALGLVHVAGWVPVVHGLVDCVPQWAWGGPEHDVPPPRGVRTASLQPRPGRAGFMPNLVALAHVLRLLGGEDPVSKDQILAATGCSDGTLLGMLRHGRAIGFCRIAEYNKDNSRGQPTALWALGSAPDARRPPREDRSAVHRRYVQARRARTAQRQLLHALAGTLRPQAAHPAAQPLPAAAAPGAQALEQVAA